MLSTRSTPPSLARTTFMSAPKAAGDAIGGDQLANTARVDVGYRGQIDEDLPMAVTQQRIDRLAKCDVTDASNELSFHLDNGNVIDLSGLYSHLDKGPQMIRRSAKHGSRTEIRRVSSTGKQEEILPDSSAIQPSDPTLRAAGGFRSSRACLRHRRR